MFKKAVEAKSHQRLSGADRKKLRRSIKDKFQRVSDSDLDALLPPKAEIAVAKFQNRVHVYAVEGGFPMFFDVDGRGSDIFPTVYALWIVPELLPAFVLKGGEVSRFVIGGADLMFPGITVPPEGLPSFRAGEPWAVKVPGNPAPIAVGSTTMSSDEALKAGLRGKALRITHYYRDLLWESPEGCYVPNAGFFEDVVFEDPSSLQASCDSDSTDVTGETSTDQQNNQKSDEVVESLDVNELQHDSASGLISPDDGENDAATGVTEGMADLKLPDTASGNDPNDQQTLSTADIDSLLDKCLLQALHTTVKDKDLPLPGSTLWSNHVLPCRPSGITLDIKKSSYKKLSKWLQSKSTSGLISVKEDKHKKEVILFTVNRKHADYSSFKPEKIRVEKSEQPSVQSANEVRTSKTLEVAEIYKPSVHVNAIFSAVGADPGKLFSASEATDIVFTYVEKENLVKPTNKSIVILDALLCDSLYKGAIKKGTTYPTEIHKKDLGSTFVSRMQPHHVVTRGNESVVRKGALKTIQLLTERRQGNKKVTKLSGMESFLIDAEALASELQKKFACSTSVAELPGKKGHEVLVQGGVIDDLARHLIEQYGVPKRYIEVLDKTKR
ncbi:eukaryotic translation initiation factor 2D isoform X1 [Vigna umbellata]|uniref:eukaryotic translation initiation factor 2D isoform X1 n=3 Tax=Vigna umbellata TaxID=87088 RepID=UPI001F5FD101|nr:eukaryotic translation initiation factor 2D isoform X1 [Vigna umbellata]